MRFIGIKDGGHDAGIAVISDTGKLLLFSQTERLTRRKGETQVGNVNQQLQAAGLDVINSNDRIFIGGNPSAALGLVDQLASAEGLSGMQIVRKYRIYCADHHLAHLAAAMMYRNEDVKEALFVIMDGAGEKMSAPHFLMINPKELRPLLLPWSFYSVGRISGKSLKVFDVSLDANKYSSILRLECLEIPGTRCEHGPGKLMGMAGYFHDVPVPEYASINMSNVKRRFAEDGFTEDLMKEYSGLYKAYIRDVRALFQELMSKWPDKHVVFGGGVALALELNTWIVLQGKNLIFCPCTSDSGLMLGYAALGFFFLRKSGRLLFAQHLSNGFLKTNFVTICL